MACSCGKTNCACDTEFMAPMRALWEIYDGIAGKADVVAIAWEREDGKVFRYDLPIPKRLDPKAAKRVSYVVERIAKFIVWSAGGWKLYLAGPDAVVKPVAKAYTKKGARAFDYDFFTSIYGRPVEAVVVPCRTPAASSSMRSSALMNVLLPLENSPITLRFRHLSCCFCRMASSRPSRSRRTSSAQL